MNLREVNDAARIWFFNVYKKQLPPHLLIISQTDYVAGFEHGAQWAIEKEKANESQANKKAKV